MKGTKYATATPYLAAYVILRDGNKAAFVLRSHTHWMDGYWGLLAGKVEKNETFTCAAIREAKEEGGVTITPADMSLKLISQRHSEDSDWVDALFEVRHWEGEAYNAEPHIHAELRWFEVDDLPDRLIPELKAYFLAIAGGKTFLEYGWE